MQLTIEVPDQLARRLESDLPHMADIIKQGLASRQSKLSGHWREVFAFLGRGPRPEEILAFRPSEQVPARSRELLGKNSAGALSATENAELEELASLDQFVTMLKVESHRQLSRSA